MIAKTPQPPYYAVIFTTIRTDVDENYEETALQMELLAKEQKGYLGIESARASVGITVSYWESLEAISNWKNNLEHIVAREKGRAVWYQQYQLRICKVERAYDFEK
jgi:heme-degrading monooxygenase HmoA